jgi:hypothetical protein
VIGQQLSTMQLLPEEKHILDASASDVADACR